MSGWDGSYEEWAQELSYQHELNYWQDNNASEEVKEVPWLFYFFTNISIHNVWAVSCKTTLVLRKWTQKDLFQ